MKVVIASDKFKGSLSSEQVAAAIEEGILAAMPDCEIDKLHVADGGDGTAASIVESTGGVWINVKSEDPLGRPVDARFGAVESRTAVIDVATASGIALLRPDEYDPLNATTKGTGILIREAIDRGFRNFNIGVGGSATNDAGTGLLSALGYRFLDARGNELEPCGRSLSRIAEIDDSQRMPELKECSFTVMCDVDAAFYGPKGAAWDSLEELLRCRMTSPSLTTLRALIWSCPSTFTQRLYSKGIGLFSPNGLTWAAERRSGFICPLMLRELATFL